MILVLLGTQDNNFNRLLNGIQNCINNKTINEKVVVQAGSTKFKSNEMEVFDFISKDNLEKLMEEARVVITHGGVGSIINCLKKNKKVIAVPRLHEYGEHVNNHQVQIVENFDQKGYVKGVFNIDDLEEIIKKIDEFNPVKFISNTGKIIEIIETYIENN